ncbi:MAG: class I SAM-dependent methyltransferase [Chitinophagaceae bacterium]|jgi:23S rRNA (cytosine1962-C5)-methyltransferase
MSDAKLIMFDNRLKKVFRILSKQAKQQGVTCYRLYDRDLPEFPLIIDMYEDEVLVTEYRSSHRLSEEEYERWFNDSLEVVQHVLGKDPLKIHIKERKRKESRQDQYQKTDNQQQHIEVREGGLKFLVNLTDFLDTGLFIDHRITRGMVAKQSAGKRVLNLFCYTGSFSVYAAQGGASEVVSVDLSNTYLDWAQKNMQLNHFNEQNFSYVKADVLQWLPKVPNEYFDLIVLDPPTFSNSKMMKDVFDIQEMHVDLINQCISKLKEDGVLYFSTNARKFEMNIEEIKGQVENITTATIPFDFKGKLLRWCYKIRKA